MFKFNLTKTYTSIYEYNNNDNIEKKLYNASSYRHVLLFADFTFFSPFDLFDATPPLPTFVESLHCWEQTLSLPHIPLAHECHVRDVAGHLREIMT